MLCLSHLDTPVGKMLLGATEKGLCLFDFQYRKSIDKILSRIEFHANDKFTVHDHPIFSSLVFQVEEYFGGNRKEFELQLDLLGTPFQINVWNALIQIPFGETRSYEEHAIFLGNEKAIRAVAGANGENGLAIIVPCHRVIGKNGSLTGYGGGLPTKKWLLDHERKISGLEKQINLF